MMEKSNHEEKTQVVVILQMKTEISHRGQLEKQARDLQTALRPKDVLFAA